MKRMLSQFPLSNKYNQEWITASASGAAHPLWLAEWLARAMDLRPGMRVLDLGCGRACSSIFLHREFGVQVWATDLWFSASENMKRIRDANADAHVFPIHANARSLPFATEFFDTIISIDSFVYYGTDDLYLNYLARFLCPGGHLGIVGAGLTKEMEGPVPEHLKTWWTPDLNCLHSADWWRRHWTRSGVVDVELADTIPNGWRMWLDWHKIIAPENLPEVQALEADRGDNLGYVRVVARRRPDVDLADPLESVHRAIGIHQLPSRKGVRASPPCKCRTAVTGSANFLRRRRVGPRRILGASAGGYPHCRAVVLICTNGSFQARPAAGVCEGARS